MEWVHTAVLLIVAGIGYWNSRSIKEVHVMVNSRLSELLALTKKSSHAEGVKEQKDKDEG